ncbi:hypothetical protein CI109_103405 [Kwoniella shandongensis]|uniref:Uncharacterized protein n=1 Tax=Kwoniella shandongensis TaxID=1734106 RepID=A0A5M6BWJ7_9TREE|nr:uncharacterized protein CI109_004486 [Kwoniella shandongensis]KAA5527194.1 hypothetical protein CI109_004486 [Kwoniella shandongensis]
MKGPPPPPLTDTWSTMTSRPSGSDVSMGQHHQPRTLPDYPTPNSRSTTSTPPPLFTTLPAYSSSVISPSSYTGTPNRRAYHPPTPESQQFMIIDQGRYSSNFSRASSTRQKRSPQSISSFPFTQSHQPLQTPPPSLTTPGRSSISATQIAPRRSLSKQIPDPPLPLPPAGALIHGDPRNTPWAKKVFEYFPTARELARKAKKSVPGPLPALPPICKRLDLFCAKGCRPPMTIEDIVKRLMTITKLDIDCPTNPRGQGVPKRPMNIFFCFQQFRRHAVTAMFPDFTTGEVSTWMAGERAVIEGLESEEFTYWEELHKSYSAQFWKEFPSYTFKKTASKKKKGADKLRPSVEPKKTAKSIKMKDQLLNRSLSASTFPRRHSSPLAVSSNCSSDSTSQASNSAFFSYNSLGIDVPEQLNPGFGKSLIQAPPPPEEYTSDPATAPSPVYGWTPTSAPQQLPRPDNAAANMPVFALLPEGSDFVPHPHLVGGHQELIPDQGLGLGLGSPFGFNTVNDSLHPPKESSHHFLRRGSSYKSYFVPLPSTSTPITPSTHLDGDGLDYNDHFVHPTYLSVASSYEAIQAPYNPHHQHQELVYNIARSHSYDPNMPFSQPQASIFIAPYTPYGQTMSTSLDGDQNTSHLMLEESYLNISPQHGTTFGTMPVNQEVRHSGNYA